jgi:hypothetical protein
MESVQNRKACLVLIDWNIDTRVVRAICDRGIRLLPVSISLTMSAKKDGKDASAKKDKPAPGPGIAAFFQKAAPVAKLAAAPAVVASPTRTKAVAAPSPSPTVKASPSRAAAASVVAAPAPVPAAAKAAVWVHTQSRA